jgi:hypothetical protein
MTWRSFSAMLARTEISRITVPSQWYQGDTLRRETAEFKLGLGPCGKVVDRLTIEFGRDYVHIFQRTTDGAHARFSYRRADITGRVTTEY